MAEVLEFLASLPTPEAIIALRPSETLQDQITTLLEKNRTVGLTSKEEQLWQGYQSEMLNPDTKLYISR